MRLALLLLARSWATAEPREACEADADGVCLLQQTFLQRSTAGESKVGLSPIPESNSGSYCRVGDVMPYWSVPGEGDWKGMTKFALSCDGEFSYCDRVREAAEMQCRMVVLEPFECVGGAGERKQAVFNGPLMPIPDKKEKRRFASINKASTFEVDGNVLLCSMFDKAMEVDESETRFDTWRLRVTKTRTELPNEPGEMRLAIQDLDVKAESFDHGHTLSPMSPGGTGEYPGQAGPAQIFDNKGEETFPLIDTSKGGTPGAITWSYDEPVCISEIRFQTAKEGWWNCYGASNCADPVQWVLEGEEKYDGQHVGWVQVLIQDSDYPMPEERATYTDFIPVQDCGETHEKEARHAESAVEIEQNARIARTKYRFNVKKTRPGHASGKPMFHIQEIEFDADRQPVSVSVPGGSVTAGAPPSRLLDGDTNNNPYIDKGATSGDYDRPLPVEFEFAEPTCIRRFRFMTSKPGWWTCGAARCGDPLEWELEGYDDSANQKAEKYGLTLDLVGSEWVPIQLQYDDFPVPMEGQQWTDWIAVSTCGEARYFDDFRFTLVKTPERHFSGNMVFALDEFEIDAVAQTSHQKLEAVNPANVDGHNPAGGADVFKAFDGMVGVEGNLPFIDDSAATADFAKNPGTLQFSLRETGCISRFRFATAPEGWWTCGGDNVCADPIQWTLEGRTSENGADWVLLQDQATDFATPRTRSTFTDWIPVSDCDKSETEHALATANARQAQALAAQRALSYRFRMTKGAKPHWSGRMLLALAEFELVTDPPVPMDRIGIDNPGGSDPNRVTYLTDGQVANGGPFLDTSSVNDDTKPEVAPLEFHFETPVCITKFRFATPQDAENAWWYGAPPNEEFGVPSQWVFEAKSNDGDWVAIQDQHTDFKVPSQRGVWADWVSVSSCSDTDLSSDFSVQSDLPANPFASSSGPSSTVEVLRETATVEVTYTHVVGYKIESASGSADQVSPLPNQVTVKECEEVCAAKADCAGFIMETKDVQDDKPGFCFVYDTDQWTSASVCHKEDIFDVFIKPSVGYDVRTKCA